MNEKEYRRIVADYTLFDVTDDQPVMIEQTQKDQPFSFISSFGLVLDDFEAALLPLEDGAEFDIVLTADKAYGEYSDDRVIEVGKQVFTVDGKFDSDNIYPDAVVPLSNANGERFLGTVVSVDTETVKLDLNHPLAGRTLNFKGTIRENHPASNKEIEQMVAMLSGQGGCCGGGCGNCGGGCDNHEKQGNGHGCGHCHH